MNRFITIISFLILTVLVSSCFSDQKNQKRAILGYDFKIFNNTEVSELANAVKKQDTSAIHQILVTNPSSINFQDGKYGHTLLMLATMHNLNFSISTLLKHGANPNLRDSYNNESAFLIACSRNNYECNTSAVSLMLKYGADIDSLQIIPKDSIRQVKDVLRTPLMIAIESNCIEIVKLLIKHGAKVNKYVYYDGYGAISVSLIQNNMEIAKYLIVDCKSPIPEYCNIKNQGKGKEERLTITDMLQKKNFKKGSKNDLYRTEILKYLESNNLR